MKGRLQIIDKLQCGIIWIKWCKDLFIFEQDVFLCNLYVPPHYSRINITNEFDLFSEKYKDKGKLLITGDLNCPTADAADTLDYDAYLDEEHLSVLTNIPQRTSRDHVIDTKGNNC